MDTEKTLCKVYIDEAGDLGVCRGTQWFVLTAVIVENNNEPAIRETLKNIKLKLNLQTIHFRKIKDFKRRSYIVQELSNCTFTCVHILFDTSQFDRSKIPNDSLAYNYICKYLLERVSWYMRDSHMTGEIILSSRGTDRDAELVAYIRDKLLPYSQNEIAPVFTGVTSKQATLWDMLQLADVCASAMFYSHEINDFGFCVPCYAIKLWGKNYQHNGKVDRYGIKYFSDNMTPPKGHLKSHRPCAQ